MTRSEFMDQLGKCVQEKRDQEDASPRLFYMITSTGDASAEIRTGQRHCPITFVYDCLREGDSAVYDLLEAGRAAKSLGLSQRDGALIYSATYGNRHICTFAGEEASKEDHAEVAEIRKEIVDICQPFVPSSRRELFESYAPTADYDLCVAKGMPV